MMRPRLNYEWSISSTRRELWCVLCPSRTSGLLTDRASGTQRAVCSKCFHDRRGEWMALLRRLPHHQFPNSNVPPFRSIKGENLVKNLIYRQGDVLIRRIGSLPTQKAVQRPSGIVAFGEVTGHAHRVEDLTKAEVLEVGAGLYMRVSSEGVRLVHEEHAPITLPPGNYEIEIQREYTPEAIRNVAD